MDHSKEIKFNYYNILAIPINHNIYSYIGKPNQPNLLFVDNGNMNSYVSQKIFIKDGVNKELVIENEPITNHNKPIFLHFPLVTNPTTQPNIIDVLIKEKKEVEINLNTLLNDDDNCKISQSMDKIDLYFQTPILIQSDLSTKNVTEGLENKFVIKDGETELDHIITGTQDMDCQEIEVANNPEKSYIKVNPLEKEYKDTFIMIVVAFGLLIVVFIYIYFIMNKLKKAFQDGDDENLRKTALRWHSIEMLFIAVIFFTGVGLLYNKPNIGLPLFIFAIIALAILVFFKLIAPDSINISPQPNTTKYIYENLLNYIPLVGFWKLINM